MCIRKHIRECIIFFYTLILLPINIDLIDKKNTHISYVNFILVIDKNFIDKHSINIIITII